MPTNTNSHSVVKWFAVVLILAAAGVAAWQYRQRQAEPKPLPPTAQTYNAPNQRPPQNNNTTTNTSQTPTQLPPSLLISIPFTSQAPTANWDELHNDACEEASVIMAYAYFNNIKSLPPEVVETEITKLTEWQDKNYGYHLSIDTTEAARMIEEVYNLNTEIVTYSETTVKRALAENKTALSHVCHYRLQRARVYYP